MHCSATVQAETGPQHTGLKPLLLPILIDPKNTNSLHNAVLMSFPLAALGLTRSMGSLLGSQSLPASMLRTQYKPAWASRRCCLLSHLKHQPR